MSFQEFSEWRVHKIGEKLFYGSVGNTSNPDFFKFCLAAKFEQPLVADFRSEDVNQQALKQGLVVRTGIDVFTTVLQLLKNSTSLLQLSLTDHNLIVDCTLFDNIALRLATETAGVDINGSLEIQQSIVESLSCALTVQTGIVDHLHKTVIQKDQALAFLAASIKDLGFTDVIRRWAPANSLNEKILKSFDFEEWLKQWSSIPDASSKSQRPAGQTNAFQDLMLKKVTFDREHCVDSPENATGTSFVGDDFGSFHSDTQNSDLSRVHPEDPKENHGQAVKIEELNQDLSVSGSENHSEIRTSASTKEQSADRQQTPFSDFAKSSSPESAVDRSPSKKKRKFGRVRVD
ncbi:LAFA_0F02762g1_1 [Lachancea sp. 'fantastica']|nr:LAFA_0F02762g1_1 [Lachancea sp. 'fantastica']